MVSRTTFVCQSSPVPLQDIPIQSFCKMFLHLWFVLIVLSKCWFTLIFCLTVHTTVFNFWNNFGCCQIIPCAIQCCFQYGSKIAGVDLVFLFVSLYCIAVFSISSSWHVPFICYCQISFQFREKSRDLLMTIVQSIEKVAKYKPLLHISFDAGLLNR